MELLAKSTNEFLSQIKDPFDKENIRLVEIKIKPADCFDKEKAAEDGFLYKATVWFKNGNTSANQDFYGNGLEDLLRQIKSEINMLT